MSNKEDCDQGTVHPNSTSSWEEEQVEFVNIPNRGRLQTQIFETRTRVHCYFDPDEATWLRLPIAWELYSPAAHHLVNLVKDVCPEWTDDADILAALRVSNYNVDDCVNTYHSSIGRDVLPSTVDSNPTKSTNQLPYRPIVFAQDSEKEDGRNRQPNGEFQNTTLEMRNLETEHAQENTAPEKANNFTAGEKNTKERVILDSITLPQRLEQPLQLAKASCQDIQEILAGVKYSVQEFVGALLPLLKRMKRLYNEQNVRLSETKALYRLEAQQRRLTYNTLIELRGNIRVFCRIRPIECRSVKECWLQASEGGELVAHLPNATKRKFCFDHIFHIDATQEEVYSKMCDIISSSVDGYNVCIMAYGQTGSGKTYTMEGPPGKPGVNILSIRELLKIVKQRQKVDFELSMSIVEIYNENVIDLLSPTDCCDVIEIRHTSQSVSIVGATWVQVRNEADMHRAISMGQKGRHVAETKLNSSSSRSHLIVSVCVVGTDKISGVVSRGQLTLCDLAGSERIEKAGVMSGERFHEATYINRSLSALAQVLAALRNNQLHIPYRNTKLTQMLQPCLGGDAKTCLIVNVTTDLTSISETLSTLQFGNSARQVALGPAKAHVTPVNSGK